MYKVEYFLTDRQRLDNDIQCKCFDSFEEAASFWHTVTNNKMGTTRLIHPPTP